MNPVRFPSGAQRLLSPRLLPPAAAGLPAALDSAPVGPAQGATVARAAVWLAALVLYPWVASPFFVYQIGAQTLVQIEAVGTTIVWAAVGTAVAITIAKVVTGLRVTPEVEYDGLDIGEHGERAYN